jgi:hypothetical protein
MKITRSSLELSVEGRRVTVDGEAFLPGYGSPDFVVYTNTILRWDDGQAIDAEAKRRILTHIEQECKTQGIQVEFE